MPHAISKTCTRCGDCVVECPTGSIFEGNTQYYIDADTCADHAACVNVCPVDAIAAIKDPLTERLAPDDEEE